MYSSAVFDVKLWELIIHSWVLNMDVPTRHFKATLVNAFEDDKERLVMSHPVDDFWALAKWRTARTLKQREQSSGWVSATFWLGAMKALVRLLQEASKDYKLLQERLGSGMLHQKCCFALVSLICIVRGLLKKNTAFLWTLQRSSWNTPHGNKIHKYNIQNANGLRLLVQ